MYCSDNATCRRRLERRQGTQHCRIQYEVRLTLCTFSFTFKKTRHYFCRRDAPKSHSDTLWAANDSRAKPYLTRWNSQMHLKVICIKYVLNTLEVQMTLQVINVNTEQKWTQDGTNQTPFFQFIDIEITVQLLQVLIYFGDYFCSYTKQ